MKTLLATVALVTVMAGTALAHPVGVGGPGHPVGHPNWGGHPGFHPGFHQGWGGGPGFHRNFAFAGHGAHFWHGRYWGYGIGPCWRRIPGGWIWVCD